MIRPTVPMVLCLVCLVAGAAEGDAAGATSAADDLATHAAALREALPPGHTVLVEPPFVIIGDEAPEQVARRAEGTVTWAARLLRKDFFEADPTGPIEVWLMRDDERYRARAKLVSGDDPPDTPYGYFDPEAQALVMNIATGGGTLVHEMVHVYVEADFPACPVWLNEGLGSLFEACREQLQHIVGVPNWRLPILHDAIRTGTTPTLQELTATTPSEFYGEDEGVRYAMARYLCYYLQEESKLRTLYKTFRDGQADDPTGYATLCAVLGEEDMAAFQKRWEAWALTLVWGR